MKIERKRTNREYKRIQGKKMKVNIEKKIREKGLKGRTMGEWVGRKRPPFFLKRFPRESVEVREFNILVRR